jgi:hypothetical protein
MIFRYYHIRQHARVFRAVTGLTLNEYEDLVDQVLPRLGVAEQKRLQAQRSERQRAIGGGRNSDLSFLNQLLLTIVWLRKYPTHETLGYLFGISDSTVGRYLKRVLPVLEELGRDGMRMPNPGKKRGRQLDDLLVDVPELAVVIDSFEQAVQRPQERTEADTYYSGKKKRHTLKSQVAVDPDSGEIVAVSDSVPGPTADMTLLKQSRLLEVLPPGVGGIGDLAYVGIGSLHPQGLGACPRRKPRGKPRPAEDVLYNTAFARQRIVVEHTIGRIRRYEALAQVDRNHRQHHNQRTVAVCGLVNHQIRSRFIH